MDLKKYIKKTLEELLLKMEVDFNNVSIAEEDGKLYRINIESDNPSILIGHHGETVYALQSLLKTLTWTKDQDFNIVLDIDDYRQHQENNVIILAEKKAKKVLQTGYEEILPPMSSYFRRLAHMHVKDNYKELVTESKGEGDRRQVVIKKK